MSEQQKQAFESWCIVELFGHQKMAGFVTEATIAGGAFIRVDVPEHDGQPAFTRFLGPAAIYAMNPCTEDIARKAAATFRPQPVNKWDLMPKPARQLASSPALDPDPSDPDDDGF